MEVRLLETASLSPLVIVARPKSVWKLFWVMVVPYVPTALATVLGADHTGLTMKAESYPYVRTPRDIMHAAM